ncbi:hypothetical protein Bca52824_011223 [Brassica carinata]|uniref:Uncharacterized protein n=1 Tax=Brassica carinata TaxID=52824 RepID=A0A8X8BAX1_BRACI|nr:hypothetical protein Bca52824_011223 [Brassica carinata]
MYRDGLKEDIRVALGSTEFSTIDDIMQAALDIEEGARERKPTKGRRTQQRLAAEPVFSSPTPDLKILDNRHLSHLPPSSLTTNGGGGGGREQSGGHGLAAMRKRRSWWSRAEWWSWGGEEETRRRRRWMCGWG